MLLTAGLLVACATPPTSPATDGTTTGARGAGGPAPRQAIVPPAPPPAPAPDPAQLVGLDRGALAALLGEPTLRREEPPAEVWLYTSEACAFHVYLYRDAADGSYRVTHYDAVPRLRRVRLQAAERCFAGLMVRADDRQRTS